MTHMQDYWSEQAGISLARLMQPISAESPGLEPLAQLCARYPQTLHPQPAGDGSELRGNLLIWLDLKISAQLRTLPLQQPADTPNRAALATLDQLEASLPGILADEALPLGRLRAQPLAASPRA